MTALIDWFASENGLSLLGSLAHSLWFGALLVSGVAAVLRLVPASKPHLRHGLVFGSQLIFLLFVLAAWAMIDQRDVSPPRATQQDLATTNLVVQTSRPVKSLEQSSIPTTSVVADQSSKDIWSIPGQKAGFLQNIGLLWIAGASFMLIWRFWQSVHTHLWASKAPELVDPLWIRLLQEEASHFGYRTKVRLRTVVDLASPAVVGILRPVLLVPQELLHSSDSQFIRAILRHELAHLKRLDPLVVAVQQIIEAILFFNPFVWILSRWSHREREAACDSIAASGGVDTAEYGQILLALAKRRGYNAPQGQQAVDHRHAASFLKERIFRLLQPGQPIARSFPFRLTLTSLIAALALVLTTRQATLYATEVLNHTQRIELIADESDLAADTFPGISDQAKIRVTTTVSLPNGDPAEAIFLAETVRNDGKRDLSGARYNPQATDEKTWRFPLKTDRQGKTALLTSIKIQAFAHGFSPAQAVLDDFSMRDLERTLRLTLRPAIASSVEVVDPEGRPIKNASIRYRYQFRKSLTASIPAGESLSTDDQGVAEWDAPENTPLILEVSAGGYEDLEVKEVRFDAASNHLKLRLVPGTPLHGSVTDRETMAGIEGAKIDYFMSERSASRAGTSWNSPVTLAHTGGDGSFITHALKPDSRHWVVARAPGYLTSFSGSADGRGVEIFGDEFSVIPGIEEPVSFELVPKSTLEIEVIPPTGVDISDFKFRVDSLVHVKGSKTWHNPWTEQVDILEQKEINDSRIYLSVEPRVEAPLRVQIYEPERRERTFVNWESGDALVADFREKSAEEKGETHVRLTFALPDDAPVPRGEVVIRWQKGERHFDSQAFPVRGGEVRAFLKDRVPGSPIQIFSSGLIGYYFSPLALGSSGSTIELQIDKLVPAGAVRLKLTGADQQFSSTVRLRLDQPVTGEYESNGRAKLGDVRYSDDYMSIMEPLENGRGSRAIYPFPSYPFRYRNDQDSLWITPVPLKTPFRLEARQGIRWNATEPIRLSGDPAIREIELELPEGITFEGNLYDKDGQPEAGREVSLIFYPEMKEGQTFIGYPATAKTDDTGHFKFNGINPQADGKYSLEMKTERGSRVLYTNVDINIDVEKPFTIYLDRRYPVNVVVRPEGQSLEGAVLSWQDLFSGTTSSKRSGRAQLDASGKVTLEVGDPLGDLSMMITVDGQSYEKKISLEKFERDQFPVSVDFNLNEKTRK